VTWVNIIPSGYQPGYREVQIWATTGVQSSPDACPNTQTAVAVPAVFPAPTVIAPLDAGPAGPPISNLVVSSVASESSDGVAHDVAHPFLFPSQVHYQSLTVKAGGYASVPGWDGSGGGSTRITVEGAAQIDGVLDVSGLGYRGGVSRLGANGGAQGESYRGIGSATLAPNSGGGGGAFGADQSGAGGGYGTTGSPGTTEPGHPLIPGGLTYGDPSLSTVYLGSGGGSSGSTSTHYGAPGGVGGGALDMAAGAIRVTGRVLANGQDGLSVLQGDTINIRGGGGGSGGSIRLSASTIDVGTGLVNANGGGGGQGNLNNNVPLDGGAGGAGRIRLEYTQSVSGTTSPSVSAARTPTSTHPDLVVSTDAAQSSDGQAHDSTNPYLIPTGSHFGNITVQAGAYASAPAWNGVTGGAVSIVTTGRVQVDGTLTAAGIGYRGGPEVASDSGLQGESFNGPGGKSTQANSGGGGGGGGGNAGGGGGGYATPGAVGHDPDNPVGPAGGGVYGDPTLSTPLLGSGGGSSDAGSQTLGGGGGNGGGSIDISAASIVVTGVVSANGQDGETKTQWGGYQGGGGASGGSIRLHAPSVDLTAGAVTAVGGAGGYGRTGDGKPISGGNGGDGRIRIEYGATFAGGTTPVASKLSYLGALDHIAITPPNASVQAGTAGQSYAITGFDASANSLGDVTASSSLTITPDGSCSGVTCQATTSGPHTVTATTAGRQVSTTLNVTPAAVERLVVSPSTKAITAGDTYRFSVEAFDQYNNDVGDVTSQAGFNVGPDGFCLGNNCTAVEPGAHTVTAAIGGVSATATLTVNAGPLSYLTLSPVATVNAGTAQSYAAQGFDGYNNLLGDITTAATFTISPDGSCTANKCTPARSGPHTVTVTDGLIVANVELTVVGTVPTPPTGVTAAGGDRSARVSFNTPAGDGGIAIATYTVTATDTTTASNGGQSATDLASPITVTGLTNGDSYTFKVHAT
ncbi:MAG: hypothetical protein QOG42_2088, partial [Solirubrobacteraceae bacterium]|nr:hypothetical protein [Solirubrobacteraceae bacterium]